MSQFTVSSQSQRMSICEDKQMLVQSMAKLLEQTATCQQKISQNNNLFVVEIKNQIIILNELKLQMHVYKNKDHKKEIFYSFQEDDLQKLLQNMEDQNKKKLKYSQYKLDLRKVSARFLCELLHNSSENLERFCNLLQLNMISGGVCINSIPPSFISILMHNPNIMEQIKNRSNSFQENMIEQNKREAPLCWYVTLQQLYNQDVEPKFFYKKQNEDIENIINDFIDPENTIFGISIQNHLQPYEIQRNSMIANSYQLIDENIVNKISPLPQSPSTKNMSNLNKSIEISSLKNIELNEKTPFQHASPQNFRKKKDGNIILQVRYSLQVKDLQGVNSYNQKRNSTDQLTLQNEFSSVNQSLNFKGENNINKLQFKQNISPNHTNINHSQLSIHKQNNSTYNQPHNNHSIHKKVNTERNIHSYDINYIPHQEINLLDKTDALLSNRNRTQDLSSSILSNQQQLMISSQRPYSQVSTNQYSHAMDTLNNIKDSNFKSSMDMNSLQCSINNERYLQQNDIPSQQQDSLFQSILSQQDCPSNQVSINSMSKLQNNAGQYNKNYKNNQNQQNISNLQNITSLQNITNFQNSTKGIQYNSTSKDTNENLSRGGSPVFKYSSNKANKYFLSPDQRANTNTKTVNYNLSMNHRTSQQNEIQSQQPDSLFQSFLTQQDCPSHQVSVSSTNKMSNQIVYNNFSNSTKGNSQSNTTKETSQSLRRCSSPGFKSSSNKVNKYFLSPEQRNNPKTVNYNISKENYNNYNQQEQKCQNNTVTNNSTKNQYNNQNKNQNLFHHSHNMSSPQNYNNTNSNKVQGSNFGNNSFNCQNFSSFMNKQYTSSCAAAATTTTTTNKGKPGSSNKIKVNQMAQQPKLDSLSNKKKLTNKLQIQTQINLLPNQQQGHKSQFKNL